MIVNALTCFPEVQNTFYNYAHTEKMRYVAPWDNYCPIPDASKIQYALYSASRGLLGYCEAYIDMCRNARNVVIVNFYDKYRASKGIIQFVHALFDIHNVKKIVFNFSANHPKYSMYERLLMSYNARMAARFENDASYRGEITDVCYWELDRVGYDKYKNRHILKKTKIVSIS
jgi:hypothetical protein